MWFALLRIVATCVAFNSVLLLYDIATYNYMSYCYVEFNITICYIS